MEVLCAAGRAVESDGLAGVVIPYVDVEFRELGRILADVFQVGIPPYELPFARSAVHQDQGYAFTPRVGEIIEGLKRAARLGSIATVRVVSTGPRVSFPAKEMRQSAKDTLDGTK